MARLELYQDGLLVSTHPFSEHTVRLGQHKDSDIQLPGLGLGAQQWTLQYTDVGWILRSAETITQLKSQQPFQLGPLTGFFYGFPVSTRERIVLKAHQLQATNGEKHINRVTIAALTGPDCGSSWTLNQTMVTIGGPGSTIALRELDGPACHLITHQGRAVLCPGKRPVRVGPYRIEAEVPVSPGDHIYVGDTILRFSSKPVSLPNFYTMVGKDRLQQLIFGRLQHLARRRRNVLLTGEPGTGKTVAAYGLHYTRHMQGGAFRVLQCSQLSTSKLTRALLGTHGEPGLLAEASSGALLLEDVDTLSAQLQLCLLSALEFGKKAGLDTRVISTARRPLDEMVEAGRFRADLFGHLAETTVKLPPLREMASHLDFYINHIQQFWYRKNPKPISDAVHSWMQEHHWPGNFRELKETLHRLLSDKPFDEHSIQYAKPVETHRYKRSL